MFVLLLNATKDKKKYVPYLFLQRGRDSNPRFQCNWNTHFPGVRLRPLGHLSKCILQIKGKNLFLKKLFYFLIVIYYRLKTAFAFWVVC